MTNRIAALLFLMLSFHVRGKPQKAPDFTITDVDGKQWNLYDQLSQGKTVVLDFFFKDCKPCQKYTPMIEQLYQDYGSDTGQVLVLGISDRDDDNAVQQFEKDFGVSYPSCGYEGGGDTVTTLFQNRYIFLGWPTYAVICPDRTIRWNVKKDDGLKALRDSLDNCPEVTLDTEISPSIETISISYVSGRKVVKIHGVRYRETYFQVEVLDLTGKTFSVESKLSEGVIEVGLDVLSVGLYLIRFRIADAEFVQKIMVN